MTKFQIAIANPFNAGCLGPLSSIPCPVESKETWAAVGVSAAIVAAAAAVGYTCVRSAMYYYGMSWGDLSSYVGSRLVEQFGKQHNEGIREAFRKDFKIGTKKPERGHAHAFCANFRRNADMGMQAFVHSVGRQPYPVSASKRDVNAGVHLFKSVRDFGYRVAWHRVSRKDVITMVDVDYYLDLAHYLRKKQPVLMYTCVPERAARVWEEGEYRFDGDELCMRIRGGGNYRHKIWDYEYDNLCIPGWFSTIFCSVERRRVCMDRQVVLIVPEYEVPWPLNCLVDVGNRLRRKTYSYGSASMVRFNSGGESSISLALPGSYDEVSLSTALYDSLRLRFKHSHKPSMSDVERMLPVSSDRQIKAAFLYDLLAGDVLPNSSADFIPTPADYYQATEPLITEDAKPTSVAVAPPLVDNPACTPGSSLNNEIAAVFGRLTKVRNITVPKPRYVSFAREFVNFVVPSPGVGAPVDSYEVWEKQVRPAQRARLRGQWGWIHLRKELTVRTFIKRECYSVPNSPRIISQVSTGHTLLLSRYTYAFKELLKNLPWYAPGKHPQDIADRVVELARTGPLVETDYSRFDGSISPWLRQYIEFAAYLRWVGVSDEPELRQLLSNELRVRTTTTRGYQTDIYGQRLSGSPLTTDGNTLINAFVSYCAFRLSGAEPELAYRKLGFYAGDDGLTNCECSFLKEAAIALGLSLDAAESTGGKIKFLGRIFYDPSSGERGSVQDPARTLAKLHISVSDVAYSDPQQALLNKAGGYLMLDPKSPLVSDWCTKIVDWHPGENITVDVADMPYNAIDQTTGEIVAWPQLSEDTAIDLVAECLNCTTADIRSWREEILRANTLGQLADIVKIPAGDPKIPCVLASRREFVLHPTPPQLPEDNSPPQHPGADSASLGATSERSRRPRGGRHRTIQRRPGVTQSSGRSVARAR